MLAKRLWDADLGVTGPFTEALGLTRRRRLCGRCCATRRRGCGRRAPVRDAGRGAGSAPSCSPDGRVSIRAIAVRLH
jgi:hypothetical protein